MTRAVVARALLGAVALVVLVPATLAVLGAYLPQLPVVGRFGLFVIEFLHWVVLLAIVPALLAWAAVRLGGGRWAKAILAATLVVVVAVGVIVGQLVVVAASHGASFDVVRQAAGPTVSRIPNERVHFAAVHGETLSVEVWWAGNRRPSGPARPAVLFLHGGGFWGGELESRPALFAALADRGYTVFDAEYRLSPPPRWDQAPADALCALAWIAGDRFDVDPTKVVVIGESAGGNLALMAAYAAGTDRIQSSCGGTPVEPAGVIAISPAADLEGIWHDGSLSKDGVRFPEAYIGGTPEQFTLRYDDASPMSLVRPDVPPTLVLIAANDQLVHPDRSRAVTDVLEQFNARYEVIVVPFADHGFDGPANAFGEQLEESIFPAFIAAHT